MHWYRRAQNYDIMPLIQKKKEEREKKQFDQMSDDMIQKFLQEQEQQKILGINIFIPEPGVLLTTGTPKSIILENIERFGDFPITLIWNDKTKNIVDASEYLRLREKGLLETPAPTDLEEEIMDIHEELSKLDPNDISKPEVQKMINILKTKQEQLKIPKYLEEAFVSKNWDFSKNIYDLRGV